ncbi:DUF4344 domain-containing metallopeptidase [Mycolicibacterium sp. Y3]
MDPFRRGQCRDRNRPSASTVGGILIALALTSTGCSSTSVTTATESTPANRGQFIAHYEEASSDATREEEKQLRDSHVLEDFVETVNSYVAIPRNVVVVARNCGEENAYYSYDAHEIELCYELSASERALLLDSGDDPEHVSDRVRESTIGTLYHEVGHALIAELGLKVTGREEDVADQLTAYMLTADEDAAAYLLTVANVYALSAAKVNALEDLPFYDTHSFDGQRAVTFLCYAYGAFPKRFGYLVEDGTLPEDRAVGCEAEYKQLDDAWAALLAPYLKG